MIHTDPLTMQYPTAVQTSLSANAIFARFDPSGRFIATAQHQGSALIWDMDSKNAIRWLEGHVKPLTSMDWSRNSKYLLTTSKDWNAIVWDIETAAEVDPCQRKRTVRFDAPVVSGSFHPKNCKILLILLSTGEAFIVDLRKGHAGRFELYDQHEGDDQRPAAFTVVHFDPIGRYVFVGTSNGSILVFHSRTKTLLARHKVTGAGIMRGFAFTKGGRRLTTNSSDRVLRLFYLPTYPSPPASSTTPSQPSTPNPQIVNQIQPESQVLEQEFEPVHRFHDPITKTAWHTMSYSPDGDWLAGGAADPANHKIYIWDIQHNGQFTTTLDGGREPLVHVDWHPSKPMIASTTSQGTVLVWHYPTPERWGAFAGGFEEVDENVVYEECEDEFDIEDENELERRKKIEEEQFVDIDTLDDLLISSSTGGTNGEVDEDTAWALDEPDDDLPGWTLKVVIEVTPEY
ncbi:WD40 repeat-like protein [Thelephora ganbajun]|uniref:WD40 repeat-like protein n=1 Tax=Thelephora ganbajun TaxID=370292 RepID=A0ACB6ZRT3_THEGA|nr:WD40 repeat-like protein [Thelephora ganbajun]